MAIFAKKQASTTKKVQVFNWRMPILAYTLNKMVRKLSTWFLLVIAIAVPILLLLGFTLGSPITIDKTKYAYLIQRITPIITSFLISFLFFFCYFKASHVFRDEITDGTLLIFNTLPMTRTRLVWEKILAYQIVIISFILMVTLLPTLAVPIFLRTEPLAFMGPFAKNMIILAGVLILIQFLISATGLLFSLIVSSKILSFLAILFISFFFLMSTAEDMVRGFSRSPVLMNSSFSPYFDPYFEQKKWDFNVKPNIEFQNLLLLNEQQFNDSGYKEWKAAVNQEYKKNLNILDNQVNIWDDSTININKEELKKSIDKIENTSKNKIDFQKMFNKILEQQNSETSDLKQAITYKFNNDISEWRKILTELEVPQSYINSVRITTVLTYFNVFKHWKMLMPNLSNIDSSGSTSFHIPDSAPINSNLGFRKDGNVMRFAPDKTHQIINIPTAYAFYILLTVGAIAATWYVFKRKDFV